MKKLITVTKFAGKILLAFAVAAFFWLPWLADGK